MHICMYLFGHYAVVMLIYAHPGNLVVCPKTLLEDPFIYVLPPLLSSSFSFFLLCMALDFLVHGVSMEHVNLLFVYGVYVTLLCEWQIFVWGKSQESSLDENGPDTYISFYVSGGFKSVFVLLHVA